MTYRRLGGGGQIWCEMGPSVGKVGEATHLSASQQNKNCFSPNLKKILMNILVFPFLFCVNINDLGYNIILIFV